MTKREKQIYDWICQNPLISQEEIAERAGITRSSVGVHISNLMKKGYLAGKGYILSCPGYYVVLGGANLDVGAVSYNTLARHDSNPGNVFTSFGGVGRNVAHNMALMGLPVKFITAFGDDIYAETMISELNKAGVDISSSLFAHGHRSSAYIYINDGKGDLELAVADMSLFNLIDSSFLTAKEKLINQSKALFIDTNLSDELFEQVINTTTVPIFSDPVSCTKAKKLIPFLDKLYALCPNVAEAEVISGVHITDSNSLLKAGDVMINRGLKRLYITLGSDGVFCMDRNGHFTLPNITKNIKDSSGSGDAFAAALMMSFDRELNIYDSAIAGLSAASICCEVEGAINNELCEEEVLRRAGLSQ